MAHYLVTARPRRGRLAELEARLGRAEFVDLRPFGQALSLSLNGMINAQSAMIAYLDDFKLMSLITLGALPLLLLFRYKRPPAAPAGAPQAAPQPVAAMAD